jgi:2,4-dienoyl-CoA reductase-like NADH-dependent reductase (Old Yellow Enzyme family)
MSILFSTLKIREIDFKNRIFVSPMCQYSAVNGVPDDWHLVHLGSRAVGGASLVMAEATGVSPEGRISPGDTGLWSTEHQQAFDRITDFIRKQSSVAGIQLAHAGRKASTAPPWKGGKALSDEEGGWQPIAPSPEPFAPDYRVPREMTKNDIEMVKGQFANAASRALNAGFEVVELHMAHGYLMHEFLSPLSNHRTDEYGGSFENRVRFPLEVTRAVRNSWPERLPLFARISATDWVEGGWDLPQSIEFAKVLKQEGVDLIDCSSGGNVPRAQIPVGPGYQVALAAGVRMAAGVMTGAVGLITKAQQAEEILSAEQADVIFLARALLRDPYWPLHAAKVLGVEIKWPVQYERARD